MPAGRPKRGWRRRVRQELLKHLAQLPGGKLLGAAPVRPFMQFRKEKFQWLRKRASILEAMGYYKLAGVNPPK